MQLLRKTVFSLFIQTQKTPNPNFLKFVPVSKLVMGSEDTVDIGSLQEASAISPLARRMFRVKGISRVFYAKEQEYNWSELKPLLYDLIQEHYESDQPLIVDRNNIEQTDIDQDDNETIKMIKQILSSRIRPFVQDDGGDVKFVEFNEETGVLTLKMEGSCSGCPSSSATLKNGILKAMAYYVGEVKDVVSTEEKQKRNQQLA